MKSEINPRDAENFNGNPPNASQLKDMMPELIPKLCAFGQVVLDHQHTKSEENSLSKILDERLHGSKIQEKFKDMFPKFVQASEQKQDQNLVLKQLVAGFVAIKVDYRKEREQKQPSGGWHEKMQRITGLKTEYIIAILMCQNVKQLLDHMISLGESALEEILGSRASTLISSRQNEDHEAEARLTEGSADGSTTNDDDLSALDGVLDYMVKTFQEEVDLGDLGNVDPHHKYKAHGSGDGSQSGVDLNQVNFHSKSKGNK